MNRAARRILPALSLAGLGLLSGGCGSADPGGSSAGPEATGTTAEPILCQGRELLSTGGCGEPRPILPPHLPPIEPVTPVAPAFPSTVACAAGETCWFDASPTNDPTGIPCSPAYQFVTTNGTSTSGYVVSYCNTVGTGASQVQAWIAANPSVGASLVYAALDGLASPPAGYGYLVFDTDPVGPAFPTPLACPAGDDCSKTGPRDASWDLTTLPCSPTWNIDDGVDDVYMAAYCSTAGAWGAEVAAYASTQLFHGSTASVYPGLPPAAPGYIYVQFYIKTIGVHCDTCGGDGAGGSSSGGSSGGSSSGGAPVQQQ